MISTSIPQLTKRQKRVFIFIGATLLATTPALVALIPKAPSEKYFEAPVEVPSAPKIDPAWNGATDFCKEKPIEDCYQQAKLRLEEELSVAIALETKRYIAQAATLPSLPTSTVCFGQSTQICSVSFMETVLDRLDTANTNQERMAAIGQAIALLDAQMGIIPGTPIASNHYSTQATIVNWLNQFKLYLGISQAPYRRQLAAPRVDYTEKQQAQPEATQP